MSEDDEDRYGLQDYCAAVDIKNSAKEIAYHLTEHKKDYVAETRKSKIQFLQRKSRVKESREGRVSTENRSLHRERNCNKCGKKSCQCKALDLSDSSIPSNLSNLSNSVSGGFAQYTSQTAKGRIGEFAMGGFINVNKIVNRDPPRNI